MISIKATKIAFYAYHNLASILEDYGVPIYKGFIPLNYKILFNMFNVMNEKFPLTHALYERYVRNMNFDTDTQSLAQKGVTSIEKIPFPHIFDLQDVCHRDDIHNMFIYIAENTPNYIA